MTDPALLAFADRLVPPPNPWVADPVGWVMRRMGGFPWSKQREIMESVRDHKRTAVHSAHDLGKSYIAAQIAAWWVDAHAVGEAFVASTAPTYQQVHSILWEEIRKTHRAGNLAGRVTLSDVWRIGSSEVGYGRKPADTDEHGFQGIHREFVLAILDEACGVPGQLWSAVEAITTNAGCRILAIGNPDDPNTEFGRVCRPGSGWNVVHMDGLGSPNFTAAAVAQHPELARLMDELGIEPTTEEIPDTLRPLLLDPAWVADKIRRWGPQSAIFLSKVRGLFSEVSANLVVPLGWLERLREPRPYVNREWETTGQGVTLGVDVGAGGDESVIAMMAGPLVSVIRRDRDPDTMRTTGQIVQAIREHRPQRVNIDVIGIGKGVVDRLHELQRDGHPDMPPGVRISGINVSAASTEPRRFVNLRSELWWNARELSQDARWDLSELDEDAIAELSAPSYTFDSSGRIKVQPKDELRKSLGRSPDSADAINLAAYSARSTGAADDIATIDPVGEPVVVRGDLVLRGRQYIDKEP